MSGQGQPSTFEVYVLEDDDGQQGQQQEQEQEQEQGAQVKAEDDEAAAAPPLTGSTTLERVRMASASDSDRFGSPHHIR